MSDKPSDAKAGGSGSVRMLVRVLAVFVVFAVVGLAVRSYLGDGGRPVERVHETSAPAIGGPFALVDHTGKAVTDADFRGKWMLVYFGYTYCPDICPTSLTRNSEALEMLGDAADSVVPILITVDPERDTAEHLADYVDFFHPRTVGLTGTTEAIADVAKAYRVYFNKVQEEGADADDYLVDHTSITYLMGPDGVFAAHFSHDLAAETMAERLRERL